MTTAIPANASELEELLGDTDRLKTVLKDKDGLKSLIVDYARAQQSEGTELFRTVRDETQRALAQWLKDNEQDSIKRLNLDPQTRPANGRRSGAYNPKAIGAPLDKEFEDSADFAKSIWHRNRDPKNAERLDRIRNSFGSMVPGDGGFLIPELLRSNLLQVALENSVVRSHATVVPMDSLRVPFPMIDVTSNASNVYGGMIGYWTEESAALTESSATFGRVVLEAKKLTGYSVVPNELFQDSIISFTSLIDTLWPRAIAFFEDKAFLRGVGAGEPLGLLNNAATVVVSKESGQAASTIVWENVVKMYSRMLPSSLNSAVWLVSPGTFPELATMALSVGTGGAPVWLANGAQGAPTSILGRPVIVTEKLPDLGTQGDIVFADLSYYLIGDRQQMSADSSPHFKFGNDQTAFRIIERVDGRPWLQSAITPANSGSTLSPFVELQTR